MRQPPTNRPPLTPHPRRGALAWLATLTLLLEGCASLTSSDAPRCSGPRRPANPYGSVLAPDAPPPAASSSASPGGCGGSRP